MAPAPPPRFTLVGPGEQRGALPEGLVLRVSEATQTVKRDIQPAACVFPDEGHFLTAHVVGPEVRNWMNSALCGVVRDGDVIITTPSRENLEESRDIAVLAAGLLAAKCCYNHGIPIPDIIQGPVPGDDLFCIPP